MKDKVIIIVGPTGVGKTSLSIKLAQKFDGEIISGDSMQVYKGLDIGTAKVTAQESQQIPHHLIDILNIEDSYSVADFQRQGRAKITDILTRHKVPIVVGGTGLYIDSLIYDYSNGGQAKADDDLRDQLQTKAEAQGNQVLYDELKQIDPEAAHKIHPNNTRRVIRALEVYLTTGQKFSDFQQEANDKAPLYDAYIIGLDTDRQVLYQRIDDRVDFMLGQGIVDEARSLYAYRDQDLQSGRAIGYKEFFPYFDGRQGLDQATDQVKQNSRRYAKRQLTWFRNKTPVTRWYDLVQNPKQIDEVKDHISKFLKDDE